MKLSSIQSSIKIAISRGRASTESMQMCLSSGLGSRRQLQQKEEPLSAPLRVIQSIFQITSLSSITKIINVTIGVISFWSFVYPIINWGNYNQRHNWMVSYVSGTSGFFKLCKKYAVWFLIYWMYILIGNFLIQYIVWFGWLRIYLVS